MEHWKELYLKKVTQCSFHSIFLFFSYSVIQHQTDTNTEIGFGTKTTKKWHSSLRVAEHPNNHIPCPSNIMCTGVSFCDVRFLFHRRFLMDDHRQINCCIGVRRMIGRELKQAMVVRMEIFPVQVIHFVFISWQTVSLFRSLYWKAFSGRGGELYLSRGYGKLSHGKQKAFFWFLHSCTRLRLILFHMIIFRFELELLLNLLGIFELEITGIF